MFTDGNRSGTLTLPLPLKMISYQVDIHDGQKSAGGGQLFTHWRLEVNGKKANYAFYGELASGASGTVSSQ